MELNEAADSGCEGATAWYLFTVTNVGDAWRLATLLRTGEYSSNPMMETISGAWPQLQLRSGEAPSAGQSLDIAAYAFLEALDIERGWRHPNSSEAPSVGDYALSRSSTHGIQSVDDAESWSRTKQRGYEDARHAFLDYCGPPRPGGEG